MTRIATPLALLACSLAGGAIGYAIGHGAALREQAKYGSPEAPHAAVSGPPAQARGPEGATPEGAQGTAAGSHYDATVERARRDPVFLRALLDQFRSEMALDRKSALLAVLRAVASDVVLEDALAWAAAADASARADGLALLAAFPIDRAEVRESVVNRLADERDPALLRSLLAMTTPAVLPAEDSAAIADGLHALTAHSDAGLRAASLTQLAQWDRSPRLESTLHSALSDPDPEVREAAIVGIGLAHAQSDRLRRSLLAMLSAPALPVQTRRSVLFALQGFTLDRAEYELYRVANELSALEQDEGR